MPWVSTRRQVSARAGWIEKLPKFEDTYRSWLWDEVRATVVLEDGALHDRVIHDEGTLMEDPKDRRRKRRGKPGRSTSDKKGNRNEEIPETSLNLRHARRKKTSEICSLLVVVFCKVLFTLLLTRCCDSFPEIVPSHAEHCFPPPDVAQQQPKREIHKQVGPKRKAGPKQFQERRGGQAHPHCFLVRVSCSVLRTNSLKHTISERHAGQMQHLQGRVRQ